MLFLKLKSNFGQLKLIQNLNDIIATSLREGFKQGQINLLVSEYDCDEYLRDNIKGW